MQHRVYGSSSKVPFPMFIHFNNLKKTRPVMTLNSNREAASLGFGALYCTEEVGGTGLGRAASAAVFEVHTRFRLVGNHVTMGH